MRKKILLAALLVTAIGGSSTQASGSLMPPAPPSNPSSNADNRVGSPAPQGAPVGTSTLLLLGLAGGFAGVKAYRNSKKND